MIFSENLQRNELEVWSGANMYLSASYNYFNGEEHFIASIRALRAEIDHISVVWQDVSNAGEPINEAARDMLSEASRLGFIDEIIHFSPDFRKKRRANELRKRQIGLEAARRANATHFLSLDTDEFYRADEVRLAKRLIEENGWKSTSVETFLHLRRPIYRAKDTTCCCFITRIDDHTQMGAPEFPCENVDSTRRMTATSEAHHHFEPRVVAMYHMNFVRSDLGQKLRNSSTVNKKFLRNVGRAVEQWAPGLSLALPNKGELEIIDVTNEFATFDPGVEIFSTRKRRWWNWIGIGGIS